MGKSEKEQKSRKKVVIEERSFFAFRLIQILLIGIACFAFFKEYKAIGMIALGCAVFGVMGRVWARHSAKNLNAKIDVEKCYMFPGDKSSIELEINNDKSTGVNFVEFSKEFKKPIVIEPDDYDAKEEKYTIRCSLIKAHQSSNYKIGFTAKKRGIESIKDVEIVTGDPFGLVEAYVQLNSSSKKEIVVYPQMVAVDISRFTKDIWEGEHNKRGVLDDVSVIKLTRPYQNNDPEKSINWRLLARGQGIVTNQYEVISPKRIHFFFDGHSFNGRAEGEIIKRLPQKDALEDALSILASLTLGLEEQGICLGFSFPETPTLKAVNIKGEEGSSMEVLYRLADFELYDVITDYDTYSGKMQKIYKHSDFELGEILEEAFNYGKCYFVTCDNKAASKSELVKRLTDAGLAVDILTYADLKLLKSGGGADG